jgi:quinol-cytochrome oxidoreductase complex cytochrome b subunit
MNEQSTKPKSIPVPDTLLARIRKRLVPESMPEDDRGRMRRVVDSLVLHLHPTKVPVSTLRWTYTWGLGGLSAVLMMVLGLTGVILLNNYTPAAPQAYLDILELRSNVWFGELVRNLHHWSANLLVVIAVLHLVRVFLTGSYRPPRELNWLIGVAMLVLVLAANFTGYLLPWDQLAFWAITVGTSIVSYVPLIGEWLVRLVLGGPEVGANTLLNFFSMHISFIPMLIFGLMSYHFWRVRKDGGLTLPKKEDDVSRPSTVSGLDQRFERVTTIPHLVNKELVFAVGWIAALLVFPCCPRAAGGDRQPRCEPQPGQSALVLPGFAGTFVAFPPAGSRGGPSGAGGIGHLPAALF